MPYAQGWDIDRVGCDGSITRSRTRAAKQTGISLAAAMVTLD